MLDLGLYVVLCLMFFDLGLIAVLMKKLDYYSKLIKLKDYEIDNIKWSYRGMGTYIQKYNLPEFDDLQIRIKNELNDIDIRKSHYAKKLGLKESEEREE